MHFTDLALLSQDEVAIAKILRENNQFNDRLAKLEAAGTADPGLVEQVRTSQDEAMAVVADIANAIRDGKLGAVTGTLLHRAGAARHRDHARASACSSPRSRTGWRGCATASPPPTAGR